MEELKSLRILLDFADEDGLRTKKEQTIKVYKPYLKDKSTSIFGGHNPSIYTLTFSLTIPEFIHSTLIGKSVPSKRSGYLKEHTNLAKSISSGTVDGLTESWCELITDFVWLKQIEKVNPQKVIFYNFKINTFINI